MGSCRQFVVAVLLTLAVVCPARAEDDPFVQPVAFLKAPEFDEPSAAATPGDDNIIYRLVHRLIPEGDRGPPPPCDITDPGPDTANFPYSPLTLPKGRSYIETIPGTYSLAGPDGTPASWSCPFMMRTGLTDNCEFRIISQGPTVVGAAADDEQQAVGAGDAAGGLFFGFGNAGGCGGDQFRLERQFAAELDGDVGPDGGEAVELRWDIVLHMAGGEQHDRQGDDLTHPLVVERVEAGADVGCCEFEIAALDRYRRQAPGHGLAKNLEFGDAFAIAAAVAAEQDGGFRIGQFRIRGHGLPL